MGDLTHVPTWAWATCFITDEMIVGWRVAANMRTQVVRRHRDGPLQSRHTVTGLR